MLLKLASFAALVASATASCPNQCSGHGRCTEFDKCECYRQGGLSNPYKYAFTGPDCSQRTCPFGRAYDAISTESAAVTSLMFKAAKSTTENKLQAFFIPTARTTAFKNLRREQKFVIKVMTTELDASDNIVGGTFAWKYDEDEYFEREVSIAKTGAAETAFHLAKANGEGSGVYVYWSANNQGSVNGWGTKSSPAIAAGDVYTFSLTYNNGYDFAEGDSNTAHQELECSGRGACDYTSGKCQCFGGYTGEACQRTACPNACSGHGSCQSQTRFVVDSKTTSAAQAYAGGYDGAQQYGCKCDAGFRGADCSQIECASGPDPMGGDGGEEGRDCSGRGVCDYTTGVCKCFKGFYGERCEGQTNFV